MIEAWKKCQFLENKKVPWWYERLCHFRPKEPTGVFLKLKIPDPWFFAPFWTFSHIVTWWRSVLKWILCRHVGFGTKPQNCFGQNFWTQNPKTEFLIENHNSGKILVSFNQNFIFQGLIALLDLVFNKFQPF